MSTSIPFNFFLSSHRPLYIEKRISKLDGVMSNFHLSSTVSFAAIRHSPSSTPNVSIRPAPTTRLEDLVHSLLSVPSAFPPPDRPSSDSTPSLSSLFFSSVISLILASSKWHRSDVNLFASADASAHSCNATTLASNSVMCSLSVLTRSAASIPSIALAFASIADLVTKSISSCISAREAAFSLISREALSVSILAIRSSSCVLASFASTAFFSCTSVSFVRSRCDAR
mmetsp:Transcript_20432/g.27966  ORF Transcript_20432/g.27966 Transcript_20432/m.27966 type:complete len:228 (-) Transcript_20432:826-1509(-)